MDITDPWATRPADAPAPAYLLSRWLFLRLLGAVYLVAFVSLAVQVPGLLGEHGILPAGAFLERVHAQYGGAAYRLFPSLCWVGAGDGMLQLLAWGGAGLALLLIAGVAPVPVLLLLWIGYLSLSVAGQTFLWFQWECLARDAERQIADRKSTRLNSSHRCISYAVFCLKKKKKNKHKYIKTLIKYKTH